MSHDVLHVPQIQVRKRQRRNLSIGLDASSAFSSHTARAFCAVAGADVAGSVVGTAITATALKDVEACTEGNIHPGALDMQPSAQGTTSRARLCPTILGAALLLLHVLLKQRQLSIASQAETHSQEGIPADSKLVPCTSLPVMAIIKTGKWSAVADIPMKKTLGGIWRAVARLC